MNITLTNFRCHRHQTFTFASGLNLIEGKSGQGKTTILDAISWCLLGKQRNVLTRGEKKCSVVLNLTTPNGLLTITRTKLPSRLVVDIHNDQMLEDDAAQQYVYQLIGGENFELTSYMLQKGTAQFFTLPAVEKRRFIESLSKQNNNLDEIKDRIQVRVKELKALLQKHQTRHEFTRESRPELPNRLDLLGLEYQVDLDLVKQLSEKVKVFYLHHQSSTKKVLGEYLQQLSSLRKVESERSDLESTINLLQTQLESTSSRLAVLDYSELVAVEEKLQLGKYYSEHQKKKVELLQAKRNYEEVVKQEEESLRQQIQQLESQLRPHIEIPDNVDLKNKYRDLLRYRDLTSRLPSEVFVDDQRQLVSRLKDIQQRKTVIGCPHCSKGLVIKVNTIAKADSIPPTEEEKEAVGKLPIEEKKLSMLEKKQMLREQLSQELSELKVDEKAEEEYTLFQQKQREANSILEKNSFINNQLSILKNTVAKDKFLSLRKQYEKELEFFKSMPKGEAVDNLSELESRLKDLQRVKIEAETLQREMVRLTQNLQRSRDKISLLSQVDSIAPEEVDRVQIEAGLIDSKLKIVEETNKKLALIREYSSARSAYKKWEQSLKKQAELVEITQKELVSLETFLRKIVEAETKCLEETIRILNRKVQEYLEKFFPDDPMRMELATEKESKKNVKTEVALRLMYKSEECDLSSLSGGEYDRCALAFLLAVNEVCGSPMLILDESIGSLDMSNSENVLEVLKETIQDKVVILVQHQATCGSYDHVVRV